MQCLTRHWEKVQSEDLDGIEEIPDHRSWVRCCLPWSWCIWPSSSQWSLHQLLVCIIINNVIIVIMILLILLIIITSWLWGERCLSDVGKRSARSWCHHQILQAAQSWSNSAFVKTLTTQNFVSDLFRIFQMNISVVSSFERKWIELSISVMNSVCSETHSWQNRMRSFYSSSTLVLKKG